MTDQPGELGAAIPIPMLLWCPKCNEQHIDAASDGWDNPPHRSHLCHECGCIWRPADVATTGGDIPLPSLGKRLEAAQSSLAATPTRNDGAGDNVIISSAADLLCQYAYYIRSVHSSELERHPYLPLVEDAALALSALSQKGGE